MSYILSALRKAERERRSRQSFSLDQVGDSAQADFPETRRAPGLVLIGCIGLCTLVVFGGLLAYWMQSSGAGNSGSVPGQVENSSFESNQVAEPVRQPAVQPQDAAPALPVGLTPEGILRVEGRPDLTRVFIQGRGYRQGDFYAEGIRISEINPGSITLTNGAESRTYQVQ